MVPPVTLPRIADAPILNSFVKQTEVVLRALQTKLGNGSATTLTLKALEDMRPDPLETGDLIDMYNAGQSQAQQYLIDLNSMETNIVDIAAKSAEVANTANIEFSNLVKGIKGILQQVPPKPPVLLQFAAISEIDKAIDDAATAVANAHAELNRQSGDVTVPPSSNNNYSPTSAGSRSYPSGSGGYSPVSYASSPVSYASSPTNNGGGYVRAASAADYSRYTGSTSVDAAIEGALDALGIHDPEARENWKRGYRVLIERESGGDPNIVNNWDSNAAAGQNSRGLTQTIPGTFSAYHVNGTSTNINDPVANVAASMNYVMHRYDVAQDGSNLQTAVQQADPRRAPRGY